MPEREADEAEQTVRRPDEGELEREPVAQTTVGTGSALGIGCLAVVALFVLLALAYRWFGGTW